MFSTLEPSSRTASQPQQPSHIARRQIAWLYSLNDIAVLRDISNSLRSDSASWQRVDVSFTISTISANVV